MKDPLPPGRFGAPVIGETLRMLKDAFAFVEGGVRAHGPIFRTRVLGRKTAVIAGADASAAFINNDNIQRSGAMPPHIQTLFGGECLPVLDGDAHFERKFFVMNAFTRDALSTYIPIMQRICAGYVGRWANAGDMRWLDGFKSLSIETILSTMMGLQAGAVMDQILADYERVGAGFSSLPIPLPGSKFSRARAALNRILAIYTASVQEHVNAPSPEQKLDGLSRILAARSPKTGRGITVHEAKTEMHHIVVAGLIVWAWMVTAVSKLSAHPDVRAKLLAEIQQKAGVGSPGLDAIDAMPYLDLVTREIRRMSPVVSTFFGKAKQDFSFQGCGIPKGWMVLWGITASHMRPQIYSDPERFDPARFAPDRAEDAKHPQAFVPNGAGGELGHKCAGYEFAPYFLKVFLIELLRNHSWQLSRPVVDYDWRKIPPSPKDGLRAVVSSR